MVPEPASGRVFRASRRVRLGDADPTGRLRLDAAARYLHDVSNDDTGDSGLTDDGSWVVRRTTIEVVQPLRMLERVELATWCSGTGGRWAERRVSIRGVRGGRLEAASLWVYVDLATMAPKRLDPGFMDLYGEAAGGRRVPARLELPAEVPAGAASMRWPLRRTDIDVLGHLNNANYWVAVEEVADPAVLAAPHRAVLEFARPVDPAHDVTVHWLDGSVWLTVAGTTHATAHLHELGAAVQTMPG
jgi:acyl-ACP thioesterase